LVPVVEHGGGDEQKHEGQGADEGEQPGRALQGRHVLRLLRGRGLRHGGDGQEAAQARLQPCRLRVAAPPSLLQARHQHLQQNRLKKKHKGNSRRGEFATSVNDICGK
jgi:hypothetical protein